MEVPNGGRGAVRSPITVIICCYCCLGAQADVPLDTNYRFPVVAKVQGQAGTDWRTEACVTNLADDPIEIRVALEGSPPHVTYVELNGHVTACSEDVVAELFQLTDYTGWMSILIEEHHGSKALPAIAAGVKIYNAASHGTYGQEIQPIHFCNGVDELEAYFGIVSGVQNWGVPGGSGFRTNIGATSLELFGQPQVVTVVVRGPNGASRWLEQFELSNMHSHQISLPPSVAVHDGYLTIRSERRMAAWVSIVDNVTGDAVFRVPIQVETSDIHGLGEVSDEAVSGLGAD